ncbi:MAG: phytoene desaturase [Bacteroidota bacterium]|jgi:phytoene desaturase
MHTKKAIIIGSGIAGLATAIRLQVQGFEVTVFEKNSHPGGKLNAFQQDGFHFDAGPSLFTQPENIEALFALAGEPIQDYFKYQSVPIACRYFFSNGKQVDAFTDAQLFAKELEEKLSEKSEKVLQYLQNSASLYKHTGSIFINHSLHKRNTWLNKRILPALKRLSPKYLFTSLNRYNEQQFNSKEAVQLFNRYATYNGSNPYKAPAMLSLIPHLELNQGTFYPQGGMINITNALYQLALKKGVQFQFDTPVQRIIHHEGKVRGVVVHDQNIDAQLVVSNVDVYFTYKHLLKHPDYAERLLRQERSSSAIIFYWGIKKTFPQLHLHNIFFSNDYRHEFNNIFHLKGISNDPTIYINITSKFDVAHAPDQSENWFVMVNVPANSGQNWDDLVAETRKNVLAKLEAQLGEPIEPLIATEQVLNPVSIESQTASYMGSLYGTSSNSKMAAFMRHANFTSTIHGLYFCGGSVHPGGGIPLCMKSAQIVGELVESDNAHTPTH